MDYFELYNLPVSFTPDQTLVKQQFYALSKKFHPDFYINESTVDQQQMLDLATENNKAYQVLNNPQRTLHYILQQQGLLPEGESYALPQDFLMEMMDVNEAIMELEFEPNPESKTDVKRSVEAIESGLNDQLSELTQGYADLAEEEKAVRLLKIKDIYYRSKYLLRIHENIDKLS